MARSKIKAGNLSDADGDVKLVGHDFHKGFTAEQVPVASTQITPRVIRCHP